MIQLTTSIQTKRAFFFSYDSNARNDEKIIALRMEHGAEGYGIYFMLIEMLLESGNNKLKAKFSALAFNLHASKEVVQSVVEDFGLFQFSEDGKSFYSESLNRRMQPLEQVIEHKRQAGIRSGEVRRAKAEARKRGKVKPLNGSVSSTRIRGISDDVALIRYDSPVFVPPQASEIDDFCADNNIKINTLDFIDFYNSKSWMIGTNEMKNWQSAVRKWHRNSLRDVDKGKHAMAKFSNLSITNFDNKKVYERF